MRIKDRRLYGARNIIAMIQERLAVHRIHLNCNLRRGTGCLSSRLPALSGIHWYNLSWPGNSGLVVNRRRKRKRRWRAQLLCTPAAEQTDEPTYNWGQSGSEDAGRDPSYRAAYRTSTPFGRALPYRGRIVLRRSYLFLLCGSQTRHLRGKRR